MSTTYTLEVPATNQDINQLIVKIVQEATSVDTRVTLQYGTCRLLCSDEAERRQFGSRVTVKEALEVLHNSKTV